MGGSIPIGYNLRERLLIINDAEAEQVREIYGLYLKLGCVSKLQERLEAVGIRSKKRLSKTGIATGDTPFSRALSTSFYRILCTWVKSDTRVPAIPDNTMRLSTR
jgi:hypothetical protein